jgi:hypothetical protein
MIPSILHQIWIQGEQHFEKTNQKCYKLVHNNKQKFSNWDHIFWSEKMIIKLIRKYEYEFPDLLSIYSSAPSHAFKSDIGRYIILYHYGGLYLDTDFEILRNFEHLVRMDKIDLALIRYNDFTKFERKVSKFNINNNFIGCIPKHPFIKDVLNNIIDSGPYLLGMNKYIYTLENGLTLFTRLVSDTYGNIESTELISNTIIDPVTWINDTHDFKSSEDILRVYPSAFGFHHMEGTWIPGIKTLKKLGKVYGELRDYWQPILIVLFIMVAVLVTMLIKSTYAHRSNIKNIKIKYNNLVDEYNDLI